MSGFDIPLADLSNSYESKISPTISHGRSAVEAVALYAIYEALITIVRSEILIKEGKINREGQVKVVRKSFTKAIRNGAGIIALLALSLAVMPWLRIPLTMINLIGATKASHDFFNIFWDSLSPLQKSEMLNTSRRAGISLRKLINNL